MRAYRAWAATPVRRGFDSAVECRRKNSCLTDPNICRTIWSYRGHRITAIGRMGAHWSAGFGGFSGVVRRLGRRKLAVLARPPREWCLAVRASDRRLAQGYEEPVEHLVTLTRSLLISICAPVQLTAPGETRQDVARQLGTTPMGIVNAAHQGRAADASYSADWRARASGAADVYGEAAGFMQA